MRRPCPTPSPPETDLVERDATTTRSFQLEGFSRINGQKMAVHRIDEHIARGTTEIWQLHNASNMYHNFHVHFVRFQVLDVDGAGTPADLGGWKDTVFLPPGATMRIIARFDTEPDPNAPFMYHCHILDHEDAGMMGQFVIVDAAGTEPAGVTSSRAVYPPWSRPAGRSSPAAGVSRRGTDVSAMWSR